MFLANIRVELRDCVFLANSVDLIYRAQISGDTESLRNEDLVLQGGISENGASMVGRLINILNHI